MPPSDLVYHFTDDSLFETFLVGIPREELLQPLRKDSNLMKRHFRGYKITDSSPDLAAIVRAYSKEIRDFANGTLRNYLCACWMRAHADCAAAGLRVMGVEPSSIADISSWLPEAHRILAAEGHPSVARRLARALAFDYPHPSIHIVLSLLSYEYERQAELKSAVDEELAVVAQDPVAQRAYLEEQVRLVQSQIADLEKAIKDASAAEDRRKDEHDQQIRQAAVDTATLDEQIRQHEEGAKLLEAQLSDTHDKLSSTRANIQSLSQRRQRLTGIIEHLEKDLASESSTALTRISELQSRLTDSSRRRHDLEGSIASVVAQIATVKAVEESIQAARESLVVVPAAPLISPSRWMNDLFEDINHPDFSSSCVTLELLRLKASGLLVKSQASERASDPSSQSLERQDLLAYSSFHAEPKWNRATLANYAWLRTLTDTTDTPEVLADLAVSGLYHCARLADDNLTEKLIHCLLGVVSGFQGSALRDLSTDSLHSALESADALPERTRLIGSLQAKLATANPRALLMLYDPLSPRARVSMKRGLVAQLSSFGLDERDPTHELLDVVNSRLDSMCAPLVSYLRAAWRRATIPALVQMREQCLRSSKTMMGIFSADTDRRLGQFRQLMGPDLSAAVREHSPDAYGRLLGVCRDFLDAELRQPEWIGSRYLTPIVVEVARCAMSADLEVRQALRAALVVELEKSQQPIGSDVRRVEVGVRITNVGTAAATDVELVVVPSPPAVAQCDIENPETRLASLGSQGTYDTRLVVAIHKPAPAIELDYVLSWSDHSQEPRESAGALKLVAQRLVDWTQAQVNPYSLRSITSPERLFGREEVVERLRLGVFGLQSFYLTGQRRVGKSSVARVLYRIFGAREDFVSLYITLGELNTRSASLLVSSLHRALVDQAPAVVRGALYDALGQESEHRMDNTRAFIMAAERLAPYIKWLCIIDDFDELDEQLYRGAEAQSFFLQLRTLIDRGVFSFVLVGSERLPEILRHQGERLNQVKRVNLDYLADYASIRSLVCAPATVYLEFPELSVKRIAHYSAGNPYYATQICMRLYEDMITRKDHYVSVPDVEHSVSSICSEESVSTFQHFWKDGVFALGSEVERLQQLNALVLIACADEAEDDSGWRTRDRITDNVALRRFAPDEIRFRLDELCGRQVLNTAGERVQLRVPLFTKWLRAIGSAAVRASFGERHWEALTAPIRRGVTNADIVALTRDLLYQGAPISEIRVKAWLEQFGSSRHQELVFELLRRLRERGVYNDQRIFPKVRTLHSLVIESHTSSGQWAQQVRKRRPTNIFVSYLDREGKSGAAMLYLYRTANQLSAHLTGPLDQAAAFLRQSSAPSIVVLVDDFVGTGGTFVEGIRRLEAMLGESQSEMPHSISGVAIVGLREGIDQVARETGVRCFVGDELGSQDRAFSPDAGIFPNDADRREAEAICRTVGEALEPKHPLGFNDCQSLIVFEHRCPNNTLPIFYKGGRSYQGREWVPLFPRV